MNTQTNLVTFPQVQSIAPALEVFSRHNKLMVDAFDTINNRQMAALHKSLQIALEPYARMQESLTLLTDRISGQIFEALKSATLFRVNFEFCVPLAKTIVQTVISAPSTYEIAPAGLPVITVRFDELGFVWINDEKIVRANARSSQHGRLFKYLEAKKGSYVTKNEMKQAMNLASSADQAIKDIQKVLRGRGYELSFERVRGDGIMYHGVISQQ